MTKKKISASVRQRLLNLSRDRREDFQYTLNSYATERFLYRLSISQYVDRFVLKGALLFIFWEKDLHRRTRDIDFLGFGESSIPQLEKIFKDICNVTVEDDGLVFLDNTVRGERIIENQQYEGSRIFVNGNLVSARIHLQFDIGFGDAVTPEPIKAEMPTLLDFSAPSLKIYPKETFISEKLEAMVKLGIANSRMKDFHDLWLLAHTFSFDGNILIQAIQNTFSRRKTSLPGTLPIALTDAFYKDREKQKQWKAFVAKVEMKLEAQDFEAVIKLIGDFLIPPMKAITDNQPFENRWMPGRAWAKEDQLIK